MLHSLHIRNFQIHKSLKIRLHPGVNTIIGPTDSGKSSTIRALRWVCLNKPRGDSFIRKGAKYASVTVTTGKHTVTRKRYRDGRNLYILDGKKFKAFGAEPPKEVSDVLNLDTLNLQLQHHQPDGTGPTFWFGLSPPEVSRQLNKIVDLTLIDTTLANLAASTRRTRSEQSVVEQRLASVRQSRRALTHVDAMHKALLGVEALQAKHATMALRAPTLRRLLEGATQTQATITDATRRNVACRKVLKGAEHLEQKWQAAHSKASALDKLLQNAERASMHWETTSKAFEETAQEFQEHMGEVCPLCGNPTIPTK